MTFKMMITTITLLMVSTISSATDLFIETGIHSGGDTLATVSFTNGSDETIKGGELFSFAIGVHTPLSESLQGRFSVGYKFDLVHASNGDLEFTRVPLEALMLQKNGSWLLGGGLTYHLSPKFTSDVASNVGPSGTVKFDDALGFVVAFDYSSHGTFSSDWYLGGRLTFIDYEVLGNSVKGNSIGVVIGYLF